MAVMSGAREYVNVVLSNRAHVKNQLHVVCF